MLKKISLLLLIFFISTTVSANFNFLNQQNISKIENSNIFKALNQHNTSNNKLNPDNSLNQRNISKEVNPDNPELQKYFNKVAEVPYKANYNSYTPKTPAKFWNDNSGDCDDKSVAFADYLYKKGAEDIRIVIITHESGKYAHACVMWKNHIFDATAEPPIYNMNRVQYYNFIEKQGFKLWMDYPYSPLENESANTNQPESTKDHL